MNARLAKAGAALVVLLVAAAGSGPAGSFVPPPGGVMNVVTPQSLDPDPAHAYNSNADKAIQSATGLTLLHFPDRAGAVAPVPDASGRPVVSGKGKVWRFRVKNGLHFSDGNTLTAKNFQWAITRNLELHTVGGRFLRDIVGAPRVLRGKARTASGITVSGNTLQIKLSRPSGDLDTRLATPFFSALPLKLPVTPPFPSGGPYFIASSAPNLIFLRQNQYYGGTRPRHVAEFVFRSNPTGNNLAQVESGLADYVIGGVDSSSAARLGAQYGVNKNQYQVHTLLETDYVALNTSRPLFGSLSMRRAANFAIDRPAMLRVRGAFAGKRTDQILPPGMGGFRDAKVYPLNAPDYRAAKRIARHRCKKVRLWTSNTATGSFLAHEFEYNLTQIGCKVRTQHFPPGVLVDKAERRGAAYDAIIVGSSSLTADPFDFEALLLGDLKASGNTNLSYFNNPEINRKLQAASLLTGPARYKTYGNLDILITKNYAPWAAYDNRNEREFVSKRVGGYLFQPANASADLNTFFHK
jgi:ABC-type transport system substrate-binding protein